MLRLNQNIVRQQIDNLLVAYPELREDEILRSDTVEGETEAFEFLAMIVQLIEDTKALQDGTSARIDELKARVQRFERREESLRSLAFKIMQAADLKKAELPCATLSVRRVPTKIVITDESALPDIACRFVRKPDMAKIRELLTDATAFCAGAELSNGGETLSIRVK